MWETRPRFEKCFWIGLRCMNNHRGKSGMKKQEVDSGQAGSACSDLDMWQRAGATGCYSPELQCCQWNTGLAEAFSGKHRVPKAKRKTIHSKMFGLKSKLQQQSRVCDRLKIIAQLYPNLSKNSPMFRQMLTCKMPCVVWRCTASAGRMAVTAYTLSVSLISCNHQNMYQLEKCFQQ